MATYIRTLKDGDDTVLPRTRSKAVAMENGELLDDVLESKQELLVSGTNIKTINNQSILGEGNIDIQGGGGTSDHRQLTNRDTENQHTINSITGLQDELNSKGTYSRPDTGIPKTDLEQSVQTSLEKADSALQEHQSLSGYATETWVEGKGYLTEHQDISSKLTEPSSGLAVGKYFRIASIDETGHAVLECVDAPSSAMKLKIDGTAQTPDIDGYVDIPKASRTKIGVMLVDDRFGLEVDSNKRLVPVTYSQTVGIEQRRALGSDGRLIHTANYDYAVKCAMTDGKGTAWTDEEKLGAQTRMGVLSTATTLPATAVINTVYDLGEQTTLAINLPTGFLGAWVEVQFISGETATSVTISSTSGLSEWTAPIEANKIYTIFAEWGRIDSTNYGWLLSYKVYTKDTV